ncbi:MAG: hypothetical protein US40_C0001G0010 [Candidatus Roizmanbacteria bacterium GW2011_GWC2_37_13]|uniref:Glycosyltransferase RgtA/B/C/D-like domain-containing protein n=1 Tax=Candidatus Roizmanbacteria bacterium GW2011_GWC2_37_13 TaxID=1618486 RepID=A0A0G0JER8_9BACT|nr:MAG: hypothetical protein US38_C0002G0010 [Candidatus Roizmanbacteria bacterium GW2011_GWC1_37_12]KKQ26661.1 MAG: hypothetical protein US40_C0001G0010 [Candidatus Roizmanbacteria bacterium GW2011_GWC2_37_13]
MLRKINRMWGVFIWLLVIGLLVYSRFVNLDWGLPYPMHPDERNMATAIQGLNCVISNFEFRISNFRECGNPHFFAYGQLPLYLGYGIVWLMKINPTLALRIISAIASIITTIIIIKIINFVSKKENNWMAWLAVIFSPYAIQLAHFGTTESLLMMFYSAVVYLSLIYSDNRIHNSKFIILNSFFCGLAIATKMSAVIFLVVPAVSIIVLSFRAKSRNLFVRSLHALRLVGMTIVVSFFFALIFSPHNLLNWQEFLSSMRYESDVALGKTLVFYMRQFVGTVQVWFQLTKVFPYALGWGIGLIGLIGLMGVGWRDRKINFLRLAFFVYFLPNAFLFAKWVRFMAPVFPILTVFAILLILNIKNEISKIHIKYQKVLHFALSSLFLLFYFLILLPGINYLTIYLKPDVRFQASEWIYKNIPENSYILSETANVVDIPVELPSYKFHKVYKVVSFNFYDLDESPDLQKELKDHLEKADYIFVPSRRIFANLNGRYPRLKEYYDNLFSGRLGFEKVAEFSAGLSDENSEETWSVFDHPVIRIYKKVKS